MGVGPTRPKLRSIEELNRLRREGFAAALAPLFEAAGPLADALFAERPFRSYEELLERAESIVNRSPVEQKIAVVNAHPRIGESGQTLRRRSPISYREQGYDRETGSDSDEVDPVNQELAELNRSYEARFGFRFVVFVNRRPRAEVVEVLKERLARSREEEMQTALRDMLAIARDRLRTLS